MNGDLRENCRLLDEKLHRAVNPDMHVRFFRTFSRDAAVYYVDGLISTDFMQHYLLFPLQNAAETVSSGEIAGCIRQRVALCEVETFFDVQEIVAQLVSGHAVVLADGMDGALSFDVRGAVRRGISPPLTESVVRGPHQGFNESIRDSITLLRRILPTPELIGEMRQIGDAIPVSLCVMYLQNAVDESSLSRLKARLEEVHIDHVLSIGALEQLLEDHPFSLLPQCVMTERPDRAASMLLEGQIVLLLDGSPQVLVLPASLLHLLHTPDDTSSRWLYGTFMRLIRLLGLLCALMLPALFVAFVTFHPQALPAALLTSILESQAEVPLSVPLEMLLMLIMFNLVGEASIRVPSLTGSTLGTVSGLILGQAAVEAKLVHPLLIIVVAVSSLGSYAVPDYSLGLAVRIGQLLLLAAGSIFGVYGIVLFMTALCVRLCSLTSLGAPFAAPLSPPRAHNPDLLTRHPLWQQRWRTMAGQCPRTICAHAAECVAGTGEDNNAANPEAPRRAASDAECADRAAVRRVDDAHWPDAAAAPLRERRVVAFCRVYAAGAVRLRRFSAAPAPNAHADADRLCPKVAGKFWRHPDYARADPPAPAGRRCVPHGAHHIFHRGHRCARLAVHADAADGVSDADCPEPRWTAARCLPAPACAVCRRCDYRHQRAFGCAPGRHRAALGRRRAAAAERHPQRVGHELGAAPAAGISGGRGARRTPAMLAGLLPCPVILLLLSLAIPPELIVPGRSLASRLALPTLFLQPAVRTLAQCLLMMTLFLSIAGSAQLAARFLTSSCQKPKKWVPYALIGLLTLTQLFDISRLWRVLTALTAWSLVPGVLLLLVLTIARICRREKA